MTLKQTITGILDKEYPGQKHWKAFVYWWLTANGYDYGPRPASVEFVDGWRDGGIDVIAWPLENQARKTVLVVQSKFYGQSPTENDIEKFRDAVNALNGSLDEFNTWLSGCREELHRPYRLLREERKHHRYILITPTRVDGALKRSLRWDDIRVHDSDVLASLERNYSEGRTPRLDEIRLSGASIPRLVASADGTRVWTFTVPTRELGYAYERHGDVLFAGNIRYALQGQTARRVRSGIDDTLRNAPHEFVFSHNGITVSGVGIRRKGKNVVMKSASIVNGAQTVSYLGSPRVMKYLPHNPARVIVRFVEVDNAELLNDIESKVAFRSNNQNKVDPSDLMIDLASLVSLQRFFRRHGVHLERKKGESKLHLGEQRISKERLAQVLAAVESPEGAVKGKRKQELFSDSAQRLFSDYDSSEVARMEALAWARVDDVAWGAIYQLASKSRRKRAELAQLASLQVFHRVIRSCKLKPAFLRSMARWDSDMDSVQLFLEASFKTVLAALLKCSSADKKNEPAFYKALESIQPAVKTATYRSRKKIRQHYQQYLA